MTKDLGLLFIRLAFGGTMAIQHGWPKLMSFAEKAATFPDPLGIGNPSVSMALAIFGELFCAAAVAVGLLGRWAAIPAAFTMGVAFAVVHAGAEWHIREVSFLYTAGFLAIAVAGSGRFSLDGVFAKSCPTKAAQRGVVAA